MDREERREEKPPGKSLKSPESWPQPSSYSSAEPAPK